jgi:hypothetical protein
LHLHGHQCELWTEAGIRKDLFLKGGSIRANDNQYNDDNGKDENEAEEGLE